MKFGLAVWRGQLVMLPFSVINKMELPADWPAIGNLTVLKQARKIT